MSTDSVGARRDHPRMTATATRAGAVVRQRWLIGLTIAWNAAEGFIAVAAGMAAGSASLIGFGLDSGIEVSAALILAWRLLQERRQGCKQDADRRAQRLIAMSFAALCVYVGIESLRDLVLLDRPESSLVGIVLATASVLTMPMLARAKRRLAPTLGSRAVQAEAAQTYLCALMSGALLVGLGANAALGWWWADPLAGVLIAAGAGYGAVATWRAESLADTCCA